jgi:glycosyltransferase involved in cell wall biosynthesis
VKLAIVSPLPGAPTGIADYTADIVRALRAEHEIELFHDRAGPPEVEGAPVFDISNLAGRDRDAVVYQMGNGPTHDFMYDWMEKVPGAVVLHDLVLHHAFARRFLQSEASRAYAADPSSREKRNLAEESHRAYLAAIEAVYPDSGERLKDAYFNTSGTLLHYAFPLFEPALRGALAVGAHGPFVVDALREARPDIPATRLAMPATPAPVRDADVDAIRARFGLTRGRPVVGCFGLVTPEKRMETVARAIDRIAPHHPDVTLLIVGHVEDAAWLNGVIRRAGVEGRTRVAGRIEAQAFAASMEVCDAIVHLRYPTARETSAALLRVLAQGRPAVIADIANQSEIPDDVVERVDLTDEEGGTARAIDRLLRDRDRAQAMGQRARRFVLDEHSDARVLETYGRLLKSFAPHYSRPSR